MPNLWKYIAHPKAEPYQFAEAEELLSDEPQAAPPEPVEDVEAAEPLPEEEPVLTEEPSENTDTLRYAQIQADRLLQDAKRQAEEIRKQAERGAEQQLAELREQARKEGYDAGFSEGEKDGAAKAEEEGRQRYQERCDALSAEVSRFLERANNALDQQMERNVDEMRDLAIAVAEKVVSVSLKSSSEVIGKMIHTAIDKRKRREWVRIYLAECDAKRLQPISPPLASLSDQVRIVPVADDESGTCIIEMPDEIIDASASTQLSNIRGIVADVPADAPRQEFEIRGGGPGHVPQYDSTGL